MTKTGNSVTGKLEVLHGRYAKRLLPLAKKLCRAAPELDPDDLLQEAFLRCNRSPTQAAFEN
jgi:DNA-directed RNA polymerase specialized sigma24 family protein